MLFDPFEAAQPRRWNSYAANPYPAVPITGSKAALEAEQAYRAHSDQARAASASMALLTPFRTMPNGMSL